MRHNPEERTKTSQAVSSRPGLLRCFLPVPLTPHVPKISHFQQGGGYALFLEGLSSRPTAERCLGM